MYCPFILNFRLWVLFYCAIDCSAHLKHMARCLRRWKSFTEPGYSTCCKLARALCTESHIAATEDARDPTLQKNESDMPKIQQAQIKNELSYHLPTVSLPSKLADSVKEVLKCERCIRVDLDVTSVMNNLRLL